MNNITSLQEAVAGLDFTVCSTQTDNQITIWLQSILSAYVTDQIANPQAGGLSSISTLVTSLQTQVTEKAQVSPSENLSA